MFLAIPKRLSQIYVKDSEYSKYEKKFLPLYEFDF